MEERTGKSHVAHYKLSQRYAEHILSPLEHFIGHKNEATGVLLLDGKWVRILGESYCIHIAYDTGIGVVDYWIDCSENKQAYGYVLRRLRDAEYALACAVSDGHGSLLSLFEEEKIPHQRCIFHILQDLRNMLVIDGELRGSNHVLYSRLKYILKSPTLENLVERIDRFRKITVPIFMSQKQLRTVGWFWNILPDSVLHLSFQPNQIPRTNNLLENLNGQIEARLKTFRGVKSEKSLHNLLKILFHFRNYK